MSLKNDLKYPFGDPINDMFDKRTKIALRNVLKLAKERVWLAQGRPGGLTSEFSDMLDDQDIDNATLSMNIIDSLIDNVETHQSES